MKDLGLDGANSTAFEGLYFNTKIKDDVTEFYSSVGKFDKLNIVNSVGDGTMVYDGTYKISPDLTFFKLGTDAMKLVIADQIRITISKTKNRKCLL